MKIRTIIIFALLTTSLFSQVYNSQSRFGMTSSGAFRNGLFGYDNPALLAYQHQPDLYFTWSVDDGWKNINHWAAFFAMPHFGLSMITDKRDGMSVNDYKISTAVGNEQASVGLGYGWSWGDVNYFDRSSYLNLGLLFRPSRYVSFGLTGFTGGGNQQEGIVDLAIRPFGNEVLSIFGDYVARSFVKPTDNRWSAGIALEAYPGFRVTGRYFENEFFTVGVDLSLGRIGFTSISNYDKDQKYVYNTYGIRMGAYDRNIFQNINTKNEYVELDMNGSLKYQKFIFFDDSKTLYAILDQIKTAREDDNVAGIAINTSGMQASRENLWELREELKRFRQSGKKVFIFIDKANINSYHFASVADKLIMDPQGMLSMEGFIAGKQYYANTLEKLGIGFHEWRYFKYKSAVETLSRTSMSEGDSVQLQKIIDDFYKVVKTDVSASRNISGQKFDDLVNNYAIFLPAEALKEGLVDTLGRWETVKQMINQLDEKSFINPGSMTKYQLPEDNFWGRKPQIAVVYALGVCDMDEGINARKLSKTIEGLGNDNNVKAIIFRVDSPGGDGMASDVVAEALKNCKSKKPVIVTQGSVAGSGGYWISMYGDTIIAAPNTLTGSIGVIGGWAYNKELKDKLGVTTDYVKRGEHADMNFGMTIPLLGVQLPDRDLTALEQKRVDNSILSMYKEFVDKVASGRNKSHQHIDSIGQGRIWSGYDGLDNGLVDILGGLQTAMDIAIKKAGLEGKQYEIKEYPDAPFFNINYFMPSLSFMGTETDGFIKHMKFRFKNIGVPMPILPLEDMSYVPIF